MSSLGKKILEHSWIISAGTLATRVLGFLREVLVAARCLWSRPTPERMRVVLTGGGTGGHVYPALAIYAALDRQRLVGEALYLGIRGRAEELIVPKHGLPIRYVHSAPWAGGSPLTRLRTLLVLTRGTVEAFVQLIRFRPHLVVATGGYVSAPVVAAAYLLKPLLKLRIVIEEQNLVPGILNKAASLLADTVMVSFRDSAYYIWSRRCVFTGYPVRRVNLDEVPDRAALKESLGLPVDCFLVLVAGGSLGSRSINRALAASLEHLAMIESLFVVHAIGLMQMPEYDALADTNRALGEIFGERFDAEMMTCRDRRGRVFYQGHKYLHSIIDYQRAADLLVSRAGAGSLAEITALGRAALVIPKRGLPGDHQELNAISIAEQGGAEVLFEHNDSEDGVDLVDSDDLVQRIGRLAADPERRAALERGARALQVRDTEARMVRCITALLEDGDLDVISHIVEPPFERFSRQFDSLVAHLDRAPQRGLYHDLYDIKVCEYLRSSNYLVVNNGIKLIGALRRVDLYPFLFDNFDRFKGFQKRNALIALKKAAAPHPRLLELIAKGLDDGYFETRREAIGLLSRFPPELRSQPSARALGDRIVGLVGRRRESFEVRAEALRCAVGLLDEESFFNLARPFLEARNVRLREAVLDAVEIGVSCGRLQSRERVRRFIKRMLVTTSQFTPEFRVRQRFVRVVESLEKDP